jgi:antagonist of KipI
MSLLIKKPGVLSTVQDLGRTGWRRFGVNPNGAMDAGAARIANILVGNDENDPLLEMHFPAAEVMFEKENIFSLGGGDLRAELDSEPVRVWRAHAASAGATLSFKSKESGERCYLAVACGIDVPKWLGSASTNLTAGIGGLEGRRLKAGDRLSVRGDHRNDVTEGLPAVSPSLLPRYSRFPTIRIIPGAEFGHLDNASRNSLLGQHFSISNRSNRMGFRLMGEPLALAYAREFISAAVCFGTIQLLPDGQLIILMADQQTAGGYPRIAHVISTDLTLLGQLGGGDKVAFHLVDILEAERLAVQFERELSFLRVACRLAYR